MRRGGFARGCGPQPREVEVINTGTELLLGNVTNTHLTFLGQELFPLGLRVDRQVCVPDGSAIREALLDTVGRADLVLVTGGLGPTTDDLTRDLVAALLGLPLAEDARILERLHAYFRRINRPFLPSIARQAQVPAGATVLDNAYGTAPGPLPAAGAARRRLRAGFAARFSAARSAARTAPDVQGRRRPAHPGFPAGDRSAPAVPHLPGGGHR